MIIVTGGYGFIGSNLIHELNNRGIKDILVVDDLTNSIAYKNLLGANFLYYIDVDDFFTKFNEWNKVDAVFHQGAISNIFETNGKLVMNRNYQFTLDLLDKCAEYRIPVSYASSASIYGNNTSNEPNPLSLYAYSKMLVDEWVTKNMTAFPLIQGWRYFNVYGNREEHKGDLASPITKFRIQAKTTGIITVFEGSETIFRDFIAVDDVIRVVINALLEPGLVSSGIRDLGTARPMSIETVAHLVKRKYGGEIKYMPFPDDLNYGYQWFTKSNIYSYSSRFLTINEWLNKQ